MPSVAGTPLGEPLHAWYEEPHGAVRAGSCTGGSGAVYADALALVNPERLLAYADLWRRLAHQWTEQSKTCEPERVKGYSTRAQLALFAAHEADELFKRRLGP
jgi:hypothetical protein